KTATPWGNARKLEALTLSQRAGDRRFASVIELLETERGERLVRFAYTTGGAVRRGPVTLRARDVERLRSALGEYPGLAEALGGVAYTAANARSRAASTSDARINAPSADPSSGSTACSGWGINPITFPRSLTTP